MQRVTVLAGVFWGLATGARGVDIPTWQVGDWWNAARSFNLDFTTTDPLNLTMRLVTRETYRLTVTEIADRPSSGAGVVRSYRRTRSNGELSGDGTANIGGISLPIDLRWQGGATTSGDDWTAIGDLANVHERFQLSGALEADIPFLGWSELAAITLDVTFNFAPPREVADFPIETVGEEWQTTVSQGLHGRILVDWNEDFLLFLGDPPDDLDEQFEVEVSQGLVFRYTGFEARAGFAQTRHIEAWPLGQAGQIAPAMSLWYEPSIKEFVEIALGNLDFGGGRGLTDFVIEILGSNLLSDPNLDILDIVPQPVTRGDFVRLTGTTQPDTPVTAAMLGQGSSGQTVSDSAGRFELSLRSPDHDDRTPANDDAGSFGVQVVAEGVGRKIVTVRLELPPTRARSSWRLYR